MMLDRLKSAAFLSIALSVASTAWAADAPPRGVYGCYDVTMMPGRPMNIMPMPFVMFGIDGNGTYSDYDGHHGHYAYDSGNGILTLTDGSREGWRYRKAGTWSFRLIDNQSGRDIYTCPLDPSKDPAHGPW